MEILIVEPRHLAPKREPQFGLDESGHPPHAAIDAEYDKQIRGEQRQDDSGRRQSLLAQAEYRGEIVLGIGLGVVAELAGISLAMIGAAVLTGGAGLWVLRSRAGRGGAPDPTDS